MPIDSSIYGLLKTQEAPDLIGTASKAMNMRNLAMQGEQMQKQASREDQEWAQKEHLRKASEYADDLEVLAGLPEPERQKAWGGVYQKHADILKDKVPDVYDPGIFRQQFAMGRQLAPQIKKRLEMAQATAMEQKADPEMFGLEKQEKRAGIRKIDAETGAKQGEARMAGMERATKLRNERNGNATTKATQEVSSAYNRIQNAAKSPSAAGDLSLIFGYMKMLDPGSTVREGEFANAQNAAGIPTQLANMYNRVQTGQRLSPEQRADFINQAKGLYGAQMSQQKKFDADIERAAYAMGVDPSYVLTNVEADQPEMQGPPAPPQGPTDGLIAPALADQMKKKLPPAKLIQAGGTKWKSLGNGKWQEVVEGEE
jgi:hypothetical protein